MIAPGYENYAEYVKSFSSTDPVVDSALSLSEKQFAHYKATMTENTKPALQHAQGDVLEMASNGAFNIVVHGCNCFCAMGSGIAAQVRRQYPAAWQVDQNTEAGDYNKLGNYTTMLGKQFNIINAYTQYKTASYPGEDVFEYESFALILRKLAHQYPGCRFGLPYIGMGLAGGNPEVIMEMLEQFAQQVAKTGGTVTLVEYVQPQAK